MASSSRVETLITSQVDGATLTAAAAASAIPAAAKFPLKPNYFDVIGKAIRLTLAGRISTVITTPGTARFDVRFTSPVPTTVTVFDSLAIALATADAYTTVPWRLVIDLTCRAIGTAGNLFGQGWWTSPNIAGAPATPPKGSLTAGLPWNVAPAVGASFDTTVQQVVDVFFTQTVATGSLTVHQYFLESLN